MPEKPQKPEKPTQGQTLSLRISDALFARLERAKQLMSSKKGDSVSTSEVAKQLLESAREDRFEVADLMAKPTDTLLEIRRKGEAQHILSRAEWILLSHFAQRGSKRIQNGRLILSPTTHSLACWTRSWPFMNCGQNVLPCEIPTTSAISLPSAALRR